MLILLIGILLKLGMSWKDKPEAPAAHPAHPCAKAMHTRVQRGVQGGVHLDRLPSEDFPEDLKVLIFQRF